MSKYTKKDILELVEEEDVEFIRLQFTDLFGGMKNLAITANHLRKALDNRVTFDGSSIKGFVDVEESDLYLYPDYNTLAMFPWRPQRDGLYHYSHYEEGSRMNKYLGGVPGVTLSSEERTHMNNAIAGLQNCSLPYDTLLWRGAESRFLDGFDDLPKRTSEWGGYPLSYKGISSTSIVKNASYIGQSNKDVYMLLIKRGGQPGAAYIEWISYNRANGLQSEQEVALQNAAKYSIIEAQKFKGKYIIVAEVL